MLEVKLNARTKSYGKTECPKQRTVKNFNKDIFL